MANGKEQKKFKQSEEEENLLRHISSLRSRAPQQYSLNLVQQNVKYFTNLNKIDAVPNEIFAPNFKCHPYRIDVNDDMFAIQTSKANEIQRKAENTVKCLTMLREQDSSR